MWGPSTGAADPIFPGKKTGDLFLVITVRVSFLLITLASLGGGVAAHFPPCKNWPLLLWGPLFVGARLAEHAEHA